MAELMIKPEYQLYADVVVEQFKSERIFLSPYSEMLLRLCVEAWFEEPPQMKDYKSWLPKTTLSINVDEKRELLGVLLARILDEISREPHIEINKEKKQPVPFASFIYGIAESGRDVLEGWLLKDNGK